MRAERGLSQEAMSKLLGVSREWVSKLENGKEEFSEFVVMKMDAMPPTDVKLRHTSTFYKVGESSTGGVVSPLAVEKTGGRVGGPLELNRQFAPAPAEPKPQQFVDHLLCYLDHARHEEGGLWHAWIELKRHLPLPEKKKNEN
jgi:transcriptional regulator with XRE-family HTH domain